MAATIPKQEPKQITAGDTATWSRSIADYPATAGWTLNYSLRSGSAAIDFSSSASGADHLVSIGISDTAIWFAGVYSAIGYVSSATERFTVWRGTIEVLPNLALESSDFDPRSTAKKILDFIDSVAIKVAQKQTVSASVAGVSMTFKTMDDLIVARNFWGGIYAKEKLAAAGAARGNILIKFVD